jgi:hypothetical protein
LTVILRLNHHPKKVEYLNRAQKKRYYAIKSPLKNRVTHNKGKFAIIIVWIISVSLASVQLFVARIQEMPDEDTSPLSASTPAYAGNFSSSSPPLNDSSTMVGRASKLVSVKKYACNENWESHHRQQTYTLFNFFAVYLIPVFILGKPAFFLL